jgi:hypothetical protein
VSRDKVNRVNRTERNLNVSVECRSIDTDYLEKRQQKKGQIPTACVRMVPEVARETRVTARHFSSVFLPHSVPPVPPGAGAVGYLAAPERRTRRTPPLASPCSAFLQARPSFFSFAFLFWRRSASCIEGGGRTFNRGNTLSTVGKKEN